MSEYQYYEFQVVDCALSKEDRAQLRGISSRLDSLRFRHRCKGRFLERLDRFEKS